MYEDFVAHLRDEAGALDYDGWVWTACDYERAADVIEELSAKLSAYEKTGVKPEEVDILARTLSKQRMALGFSTVEEFQSFLDKIIEDKSILGALVNHRQEMRETGTCCLTMDRKTKEFK